MSELALLIAIPVAFIGCAYGLFLIIESYYFERYMRNYYLSMAISERMKKALIQRLTNRGKG